MTQMSVFYAPNASAVANSWDHYMLIDAPDNSLGTLNKDGTKSGMCCNLVNFSNVMTRTAWLYDAASVLLSRSKC